MYNVLVVINNDIFALKAEIPIALFKWSIVCCHSCWIRILLSTYLLQFVSNLCYKIHYKEAGYLYYILSRLIKGCKTQILSVRMSIWMLQHWVKAFYNINNKINFLVFLSRSNLFLFDIHEPSSFLSSLSSHIYF